MILIIITIIRRSDVEKHITTKNCDKTLIKNISRSKILNE